MSDLQVHQTALQCPSCAGQQAFDPQSQRLVCASCGTAHEIEVIEGVDASVELEFDPSAPPPEPAFLVKQRVYGCATCGGTVTFTGAALSEHCPYCNGPVVLGLQEAGFETMGLIPFGATRDTAEQHVRTWGRKRWAAPHGLSASIAQGRMSGLYAPFWTFDSHEALDYWASYRVKSGDRTVTRRTSGSMTIRFDDLLMPASPHVTPLLRDGVLHDFRPQDLVPFMPEYLAGFAAEGHHETVAYGLRANERDKDVLIRNRIKRRVNKRGVHGIGYKTDTTGIRYRRILLPMWIHHYDHNGTSYRIVVSGIDGRTFGERPFSKLKLFGYAAAISALAVGVGIAWGAAGLL